MTLKHSIYFLANVSLNLSYMFNCSRRGKQNGVPAYVTFGCERCDDSALSQIGTQTHTQSLKVNSVNQWWGGKHE
jgi:hypothetical protein